VQCILLACGSGKAAVFLFSPVQQKFWQLQVPFKGFLMQEGINTTQIKL
jgi:hypothetical protein